LIIPCATIPPAEVTTTLMLFIELYISIGFSV
jgi:hypothetical protein